MAVHYKSRTTVLQIVLKRLRESIKQFNNIGLNENKTLKIGKKENAESQQENSDSRSDIYKALIIGIT